MDAVKFLQELSRLHESKGSACLKYVCPEEVVAFVEKWSKEHPVKTNADKFKEVFGITIWESIDKGHGDWSSWLDAPYEG